MTQELMMSTHLWHGPRLPLEEKRIPIPQIEDRLDVVVRIRAANFGAALGRAVTVGHPKLKPPAVLGTLIAGDIIAKGDGISLPLGARITVDPHPPCNHCANCRNNLEALCTTKYTLEPGGMSEYVRIRGPLSHSIHLIPEQVTYAEAAYTEIVACVMEATRLGNIEFGDSVVIIGCGPTALIQIQLAHLRGAGKVICLFNHMERQDRIAELGAIPIYSLEADFEETIHQITDGGANTVIEQVGTPETYSLALRLVRSGGTVVGFGGSKKDTNIQIDPNFIHYQNITFKGSYHYRRGTFERALKLLNLKKIQLHSILTHSIPLNQVNEAAALIKHPDCIALMVRSQD
ncbi:L-iditol 2-dehydrogenase [Paenibacillus shirakamiensis]|uniref:L-iditol 2-dehydrogenase n=1 Tax=Paenibacillus shirakamiensis TaxID=1265935 RepID=A0ABS4JFN3_9BACL|nr:zinc-binding dehydrogenase [Paenibacillus shirakamiensis]MBP1999936.1 L-iditol 2-dehydrogenase [Paenibacillus shirakamiensis]